MTKKTKTSTEVTVTKARKTKNSQKTLTVAKTLSALRTENKEIREDKEELMLIIETSANLQEKMTDDFTKATNKITDLKVIVQNLKKKLTQEKQKTSRLSNTCRKLSEQRNNALDSLAIAEAYIDSKASEKDKESSNEITKVVQGKMSQEDAKQFQRFLSNLFTNGTEIRSEDVEMDHEETMQ